MSSKRKHISHGMDKPQLQAVRQKEIKDIPPDEIEARKKLVIPVEPAMPCVIQGRIATAKAPTQKDVVSKWSGRRPPALSERRSCLTRTGDTEAFESEKVYSSTKTIFRVTTTLQIEDHLVHTPVLFRKAMKIPEAKIASGQRLGIISKTACVGYVNSQKK